MLILVLLLAIAIGLAFFGCGSVVLIYAGIAAGIILAVIINKIYEKQCEINNKLDYLVSENDREKGNNSEASNHNKTDNP